jgi:hypothetical protein
MKRTSPIFQNWLLCTYIKVPNTHHLFCCTSPTVTGKVMPSPLLRQINPVHKFAFSLSIIIITTITSILGQAVAQWLRHCATNRKVAGSIPYGVIGIFQWHNPSGRTMALGSTQPLTEMSTRNISWGKGGRSVGLTTLPTLCADCFKIWKPQLPGTLRACQGL